MWSSACPVAWEATESSRFLQLIRLQDGSAESLPMRIWLMGWEWGGMLTITCCYSCLQRPRCPNYSELIVSQSNFFVAISWVNTWRQAEVECSSSTSKGTGNPRNGSEFLPTELLGMRVKWTGTDGLPCLQHIVCMIYCMICIILIDIVRRYSKDE